MDILNFLQLKNNDIQWFDRERRITLAVGSSLIQFYDDDYLSSHNPGSLQDIVMQVGLSREEYFYKYGVAKGYLADQAKIQEMHFRKDTEIEFFPNGKVKNGVLDVHVKINKKNYDAGTFIWFKEDGKVEFAR